MYGTGRVANSLPYVERVDEVWTDGRELGGGGF